MATSHRHQPAGYDTSEHPDSAQEYSALRLQLIILGNTMPIDLPPVLSLPLPTPNSLETGIFPLSEAIAWASIFPYIVFMVQSLSQADKSHTNASVYASLMVSLFTFGEFLMAIVWAKISDRIGRKPTLLIGSAAGIVSAVGFGLSTSLPAALAARLFAGMANPNLGVVQTFVGELVKERALQAKGFSVVPFLRGLGTLIGPVIGGYFASPAQKFSSSFHRDTIFYRFPYLLPNLIVACFHFLSWTIGFLFLREVHPQFQRSVGISRKVTGFIAKISRRWDFSRNNREFYDLVEQGDEEVVVELHQTSPSASHGVSEANNADPLHAPATESPISGTPYPLQTRLQILSVALLGFLKIGFLIIIPIFLSIPSSSRAKSQPTEMKERSSIFEFTQGFGMDAQRISNVLLSQAIAAVLAQFIVIPRIIAIEGALMSYRCGMAVQVLIFMIMPFTVILPAWMALPVFLGMLWAYALVNSLVTVSSAILITNTAPSAIYLATINGTAASMGCLARTLGPLVVGPMCRWGIRSGYVGLPFWTLSLVAGADVVLSLSLRDYP